ncbi:unnamed protein product [Urochloa decumbens]|uniref:DUF1618 domain-containing protein n=1 Tax=Urochloa decumbens TaxID=240449 RepID=A0ABC9H422_9POAL
MSAAGRFPSWVLLEPFVFRRDDDDSFPEESSAPIRASATTSWGADIRIAFSVAEPPRISRLYAQLPEPGFLGPRKSTPLAILATHRHLALLRLAGKIQGLTLQDLFIYSATATDEKSSLMALPSCTEPGFDYTRADGRRLPPSSSPRLLAVKSMGLWCRGEDDEFVVAELSLYIPSETSTEVFADICLLRSSSSTAAGGPAAKWDTFRVEIPCSDDDNPDGHAWQISRWQTDSVISFRQWLCWIDYNRGILLLCDMSKLPARPSVSFLRFPLHEFPSTNIHTYAFSFLYRGVSVVGHGSALKFVNVARQDGHAFGALKPGTGFTITCHTLVLGGGGGMAWKEDYRVSSDELWEVNCFAHDILMFPRVDIDRPHVAHFLSIEFKYVNKKMWTISIDMSTKAVESFSLYINGKEGLQSDDADLIKLKSMAPLPFLPCEFPKFLHLSSS